MKETEQHNDDLLSRSNPTRSALPHREADAQVTKDDVTQQVDALLAIGWIDQDEHGHIIPGSRFASSPGSPV